MRKMGQKNDQNKIFFFNLLDNLEINFFWTYFIIKIYIISFSPKQTYI